jgi:hypothetical protein
MATRERLTIDLRGLGGALRAHARARDLTVSDVARRSIAAAIESSPASTGVSRVEIASGAATDPVVKLRIRLRRDVAEVLSTRARAAGVSPGAYLATVLDGMPAPSGEVTADLARSTEALAIVSADLNELIRAFRVSDVDGRLRDDFRALAHELSRHLGLASQVVAKLRPAAGHSSARHFARKTAQRAGR